jgi:1,6-anhydro-N-acetylmuramate kinase
MTAATRLVIGCMTGTSLDGLDVALVAIDGHGLAMRPRLLRGHAHGLHHLGPALRDLAEQKPMTAGAIASLLRSFSILHRDAIAATLGNEHCDLIAVHGQTVVHVPPVSWQCFQPAPVAQAFRVPVVFDLRAADLACGGQGAPITPLADWICLRDAQETRVVVNLGGFCNATILPAGGGVDSIRGFDVCACNQILDAIARRCFAADYDDDGLQALAGTAGDLPTQHIRTALMAQRAAKRSLGTGDELQRLVSELAEQVRGPDLARSACRAIAQTISAACGPGRYCLAGGGAANRALVAELSACCPGGVVPSGDLGLDGTWREAMAMAILGALCQDRVPITIPHVTGLDGPAPIAGCWALP